MPALTRVGHKGADHIAPGNTGASFDAAIAAGVDMIEFDVLPEHPDGTGELYLAHDYRALRGGEPLTLEQGLTHLAGETFGEVELDVDMKLPGYELRVLEALRRHGLADRALVSSMYPRSLAVVRAHDSSLRLGWSVPRIKRDYTTDLLTRVPALAIGIGFRSWLPYGAARAIRAGRCDALMSHWRLVTPRLVRAIHRAGGELFVWTVDDAERIAWLEDIGVDGVITNDPRLFGAER
jgi:glycerophosphoryl diester phosphodiesterase